MKRWYRAVKIFIFFFLVFILIGVASRLMQRKESQRKYQDFMELADQVDVLFLGSSHVLNGINPLQLYREQGITAYNMGKHGGMVTESYWMLMNALDYCKPKCVVVDLWALDRNYQYVDVMNGYESKEELRNSVSLLHNNMDFWPLSRMKVAAVRDLIQDPEIRKEFLWDFTLYHDRWSTLNSDDFTVFGGQLQSDYLLGAEQRQELYLNPSIGQAEDVTQVLPGESVCVEYLDKILSVCEERDIDVMLTFLPMARSYEQDRQAVNTAAQIAKERGILFLNMLPQETQTLIDYYTDMSDDTHLNANGMRKVTAYIGLVLKDVYELPDHRADASYAAWDTRAAEWQSDEIHRLCGRPNLYTELGAIQNVNASVVLYMRGDSKAIHDVAVRRLVNQLTGTAVIDEAASVNGPYLLIRDASGGGSGEPIHYEFAGEAQTEQFVTLLGETEYIGLSNFSAVYVDEDYENNYLDMEEHYNDEVQLLILGQQGEVIGRVYYGAEWKAVE